MTLLRTVVLATLLATLSIGQALAGQCCYSAAKDYWCERSDPENKGSCVQAWDNPDPSRYKGRFGGPSETRCDTVSSKDACRSGTYKS